MSTVYSEASVIIPNSAGVKAGTLQAWRPDVNLLQNIDVSRPATTNVASYVNKEGVRVFVGANIARWDWSEGGSCPSLLVEPQRTNLFDQDLAGAGIATKTVTVVNGTEYSVSVEGSGSMTLSGAGTGTVSEGSHVTFTASTTSLTLTYTAPLTYVQVEAGAYPSSIIYTNGGIATRNKDVISKAAIGSLIGQSEGALYIKAKAFSNSGSAISFADTTGSSTDRVLLRFIGTGNRASVFITRSGTNVVALDTPVNSVLPDTTYKIALRYALNDFAIYINSVNNGTDSSVTPFSGQLTDFKLSDQAGGANFTGRIYSIAWWKTKLTDAELTDLTTP